MNMGSDGLIYAEKKKSDSEQLKNKQKKSMP